MKGRTMAVLLSLAPLLGGAMAVSAVLVTDPAMTRLVALSERGAQCSYSTDRAFIQRRVLGAPRHMVHEETEGGMDDLLEACRARGGNKSFLYPGTKWCGPGNAAVAYGDLGPLEPEDRCCREHDHCPAQLGSGECKNSLCNSSPFTRSHCDCDARFRRCLQTVNSGTANTLGAVFFNVVQVLCFKEQRPCPGDPCSARFLAMPLYQELRSEGVAVSSLLASVARFFSGA